MPKRKVNENTHTTDKAVVRKTAAKYRETSTPNQASTNQDALSIGATLTVNATGWDKTRRNKTGEAEYAAKHGTDPAVNKMQSHITDKKWTKYINKHVGWVRRRVNELTLPWDQGQRRVPALMVPKVMKYIAEARAEYDRLVEKFVQKWPDIRKDCEVKHNGDFAKFAHLIPAADNLDAVRRRFVLSFNWNALGGLEDIHSDVREIWENQQQERFNAITEQLRERFRDKLNHLASRCAVAGDEGTRWAKSTLGHVVELCEMIPSMMEAEWVDNELLLAIDNAKHMLAGVDDDSIKSSKIVANEVRAKATEIANSLM